MNYNNRTYILDTKWKYKNDTSAEDIRQMYVYGNYWGAKKRYLLYPDKVVSEVKKMEGTFYDPTTDEISEGDTCGLMFIDLVNSDNSLNKKIGNRILEELLNENT